MGQQRRLGDNAETPDFLGGKQRHLRNLVCIGIRIDIGIADKHRAIGKHQQIHCIVVLRHRPQPNDLVNVVKMQVMRAECATQHAIGFTAVYQHCANQRQPSAHLDLRILYRHAAALGQAVILLPVFGVTLIPLVVDHINVDARLYAQSISLDTALQHLWPADQNGPGKALIDDHLDRPQHTLILAFGVDNAARRTGLRGRK